jgi:uncharacterized protein YbdZ (MbtH family)
VTDGNRARFKALRKIATLKVCLCASVVRADAQSQKQVQAFAKLPDWSGLRDESIFASAKKGVGGHSVVWPGELDMGAGRLWELALEQQGRHDAVQFIRWRWRYALSLSESAEAIGISRRQLAYYASGRHVVPRTGLLACKGWEADRKLA